jgi:hypothetical protein
MSQCTPSTTIKNKKEIEFYPQHVVRACVMQARIKVLPSHSLSFSNFRSQVPKKAQSLKIEPGLK